MRRKRTTSGHILMVALLVTLAAAVSGVATSASFAAEPTAAGDPRASEWTNVGAPAKAPSLTNDTGEADGGSGAGFVIGIALIALSAVWVAVAVAIKREDGDSPGGEPGEWPDPLARSHS